MSDIKEIYVVRDDDCFPAMAFVEKTRAEAYINDLKITSNEKFSIQAVELSMDETKINYTTVNSEEVKQQDKTVELNNLMNENKYLHSEIERLQAENKRLIRKIAACPMCEVRANLDKKQETPKYFTHRIALEEPEKWKQDP
jgi:predicted RNase H-like nuclease (RuvC/YqgF family)